jgi:hypothetical protein
MSVTLRVVFNGFNFFPQIAVTTCLEIKDENPGQVLYSQHFFFFVTYEWA